MPRHLVLAFVIILIAAGVFLGTVKLLDRFAPSSNRNTNSSRPPSASGDVVAFQSADDYRAYLDQTEFAFNTDLFSTRATRTSLAAPSGVEEIGGSVGLGATDTKTAPTVDRTSTTNVQVAGIDEPDIVKTNGQQIYVSSNQPYYVMERAVAPSADGSIVPPTPVATTKVVTAFPVDALTKIGSIDKVGNLLLEGKTLVVFAASTIYGYDVTDPASPKQSWSVDLGTQTSLSTARLANGKLYVVTQTYPDRRVLCPMAPLKLNGVDVSIPCDGIFHPTAPVPNDVVYTILRLTPSTGSVEAKTSFVGSTGYSVVSMSSQAIYLTYTTMADWTTMSYQFMNEAARDLFPSSLLEKLRKLEGYDLSQAAKYTELEQLMSQYVEGLSQEAATAFEKSIAERAKTYSQQHVRDFATTFVARIPIDTLAVSAVGSVPGQPLNQFALDEDDGVLRIATTSGASFFAWGGTGQSVNDIYTLDEHLKKLGSVLDLGKGERIYSVRFIGHRGYVVTFRQTDPFYVLDLTDPKAPVKSGELKIPGYSSYLDPLSDTLVLGVGREESKVKLSLFDVTDAANPTEVAKKTLDAYWTEVENNHHAFLKDDRRHAFFLPTSSGGLVFSYGGNQLVQQASVSDESVQRAVYINDVLYVIGASRIVAYDETTWQEVKRLAL